jgi:arylformamidase
MTRRIDDPAWCEREYNPRLIVPETAEMTGAWAGRAEAARDRYPSRSEIRYGEHPRETLDLFRAPEARGAVLFIHGGYWRAFSKDAFSWVADGFVPAGITVAVLNYPLCPDATLARIVEATRSAFIHLHGVLTEAERRRLVVTGHSAGGYLTALHLATDWAALGLPERPIAGAVPISGVFDVEPLVNTSMNEALRLDAAEARRLSLHTEPVRSPAPAVFVVGGAESAEFHRQSDAMARHWPTMPTRVLDLPGLNHFDVIDGLGEPGSVLNRVVVEMIDGSVDLASGGGVKS